MKQLGSGASMPDIFALALSLIGCGNPPPPVEQQFAVELSVRSDDGSPIAGADLSRGKRSLGSTDADGRLRLRISGPEGELVPLLLTCPDHFAQPVGPLSLRLATTRRIGEKSPGPQKLDATCARKARDVVVVVHAPGGEALPIRVNGESAGSTDPDGDGHVLLQVARDVKALDVQLDTTTRRDLVPSSPHKVFSLDNRDTILLVEQPFAPRRATAPASKPHTTRRHVPTRID